MTWFELIPTAAVADFQSTMDSLMDDECLIEREDSGTGVYDDSTYTSTLGRATIYEGACYLGDRVEGALTTGGFGANAQESAYDARQHSMLLRLPISSTEAANVVVGDICTMQGTFASPDSYRVTAREEGTTRSALTFRLSRFDADASRS